MTSRSSSVNLPQRVLTEPLICFHLPSTWSQFMNLPEYFLLLEGSGSELEAAIRRKPDEQGKIELGRAALLKRSASVPIQPLLGGSSVRQEKLWQARKLSCQDKSLPT